MEYIRFQNVIAKGLKKGSDLYAPDYLPLQLECKDCNFEILSGIFAEFENTSFKFENVTFDGETPYLKGLDGVIKTIEQELS